jgi:hypothetical protein
MATVNKDNDTRQNRSRQTRRRTRELVGNMKDVVRGKKRQQGYKKAIDPLLLLLGLLGMPADKLIGSLVTPSLVSASVH